MPSPFRAFGLQEGPLRCASATGQILQAERCGGGGQGIRVVSQFDAGSSESPASCSTSHSLRSERDHARGLFFLPKSLSRSGLNPKSSRHQQHASRPCVVTALGGGGGGRDMGETEPKDLRSDAGGDMQALDAAWASRNLGASSSSRSGDSADGAGWEQLSMAFRIGYSVAMYGGLAFAGHVICSFTGVDLRGGFSLSPEVVTTGFGYAVPPMVALLFILEDEVVKSWAPARAIRDVEDEELLEFFAGMAPWQFPMVVAAGAVAEELFFRVAIQGGLTHALQVSDKGVAGSTVGLAALTGVVPLFVPFAQAFAAALTAALTSSMYYVMAAPRDPKYVVAPAARGGRHNRGDIKERVAAWYARRQQRKIYSPLVEGLLALYLGFEWMHTGNILAPIITHTLYSLVIVGTGLRRINDNRDRLRQRVSKISGQRSARLDNRGSGSS